MTEEECEVGASVGGSCGSLVVTAVSLNVQIGKLRYMALM